MTRAELVNEEWTREVARKESLERKGLAVITTSGALVTLIFAFATVVQKGQHFKDFANYERWLIGFALLAFVISAVFGIAVSRPRNYALVRRETLERPGSNPEPPGHNPGPNIRPDDPIAEKTLEDLINALEQNRIRNDTKASALGLSIWFQTIAVGLIAGAILAVIWP
jgi:hypothetical protein